MSTITHDKLATLGSKINDLQNVGTTLKQDIEKMKMSIQTQITETVQH